MEDYIELPTIEVRKWISNAALECGYPEQHADGLGYAAWWLENRGVNGVMRACVYLQGIHGKIYDAPAPENRDKTISELCPITCGGSLGFQFEIEFGNQEIWETQTITADPLLMAPLLAFSIEYTYNVHLHYGGQHVVLNEHGVAIRSSSFTEVGSIDTRSGVETSVRLVRIDHEKVRLDRKYAKKETLKAPAARYLAGGKFRFD